MLLLIHPARDRDQHEPERIENAHPSTVSRVISATTHHPVVFSAFEFWTQRDELFAHKVAQARIVSELEDKPWKLHEFMAADHDGNLTRVFYDFCGDM